MSQITVTGAEPNDFANEIAVCLDAAQKRGLKNVEW